MDLLDPDLVSLFRVPRARLEAVVNVEESVTVSPGFRRGWNFGELVIGLALPITRVDGRSTGALLTYFSYELPFR